MPVEEIQSRKGLDAPCCNYGLNTSLQLYYADLGGLIKRNGGDVERVGQAGKTIGFVLVVEGI